MFDLYFRELGYVLVRCLVQYLDVDGKMEADMFLDIGRDTEYTRTGVDTDKLQRIDGYMEEPEVARDCQGNCYTTCS